MARWACRRQWVSAERRRAAARTVPRFPLPSHSQAFRDRGGARAAPCQRSPGGKAGWRERRGCLWSDIRSAALRSDGGGRRWVRGGLRRAVRPSARLSRAAPPPFWAVSSTNYRSQYARRRGAMFPPLGRAVRAGRSGASRDMALFPAFAGAAERGEPSTGSSEGSRKGKVLEEPSFPQDPPRGPLLGRLFCSVRVLFRAPRRACFGRQPARVYPRAPPTPWGRGVRGAAAAAGARRRLGGLWSLGSAAEGLVRPDGPAAGSVPQALLPGVVCPQPASLLPSGAGYPRTCGAHRRTRRRACRGRSE